MKHTKKFLALVLSLAVVASLAAAGTLAYLNANTTTVTNAFSVGTDGKNGAIKVSLDEADIANPGQRTTTGNTYENVFPGSELQKDPTVHIAEDSESCWVFVGVKNENANLLQIQNLNADMTKVGTTTTTEKLGYDVYLINAVQNAKANFKVFDGVKVPAGADDISAINSQTIKVAAYAIQAANINDFNAAVVAGWSGTANGEGGAQAFFAGL